MADLSVGNYPTMSRITPLIKGVRLKIKNKSMKTDVGLKLQSSLINVVYRRVGYLETTNVVAKASFFGSKIQKGGLWNYRKWK